MFINKDDSVKISLRIERNKYWRRHFVLHLTVQVPGREVIKKLFYHHRYPTEAQPQQNE
jgi:hypothetical protein